MLIKCFSLTSHKCCEIYFSSISIKKIPTNITVQYELVSGGKDSISRLSTDFYDSVSLDPLKSFSYDSIQQFSFRSHLY